MESGEKMLYFMHTHIRVFLQIEADHTEPLGRPGPSGDTDAPHVGTDVSTSTDSRIEVLLLSAMYGTSRGGGGGGDWHRERGYGCLLTISWSGHLEEPLWEIVRRQPPGECTKSQLKSLKRH